MTRKRAAMNEESIKKLIERTERDGILPAKLYLVPTPIGNLSDISLRAIRVLEGAEEIYCEDTRGSLKLLNALEIKKPLFSCHEHNERQRAEEILQKVRCGAAVAFISDAGMPAVSDPGERLVRVFSENDAPFEVLPGANAALTAWIMSALPTDRLYFAGFLPRGGAERAAAIADIARAPATSVVYESPLRVGNTLAELRDRLGDRPCALVREISKIHEETVRGTLSSLSLRYREEPPKGECVVVIGRSEPDGAPDDEKPRELIKMLLRSGCSAGDAARIAAFALDEQKNRMYRLAVESGKEERDE